MELHEIVAELRAARIARGMTQADLSRAMGMRTQGWISDIETGYADPSPRTIRRMAEALGVEMDPERLMIVRHRLGTE